MKRALLLTSLGLATLSAAPAAAQDGFALKGYYLFNQNPAEELQDYRLPAEDGLGLGAEFVLPGGLGLGVTGYTAGQTDAFDVETTELTILGEVNYFLPLPLPLSPYAGVHAGLGRISRDNADDPDFELQDDTREQLGYQFGVRIQPTSLIGIDLQWRRMSSAAAEGQDERLQREQFLLGVTLF